MTDPAIARAVGTIDHVVIVVADLLREADVWRRLGFTLSPKGVHSAKLGSANHTIMLQRDYFELLSVVEPTPRNAEWRAFLAEGGGIGGLALTTEDAAAARDLWRAAGLDADDPLPFARPVVRADGSRLEARFEVVSLGRVPATGLRIFVCSQPTREAVWLPELMHHANGAVAVDRLVVEAPDPAAAAAAWQAIVPTAVATPTATGVTLATAAHRIDLVRPAAGAASAPPRAVGIDFRVADLAQARAAVVRGGVAHVAGPTRIDVPPAAASNVAVGFVA